MWILIFLFSRIPFLYSPFHGEPDVYRMTTGIYENVASGEGIYGSNLYGIHFSFGYYFLIFKILSIAPVFLRNIETLLYLMTLFSCIAIIFFLIKLHMIYSRSIFHTNIFLALFLFSPVCWETSTYSHPVFPALAALLGAIVCLVHTKGKVIDKRTVFYYLLSIFLFFVSLTFRAEILLIYPVILFLFYEPRNKRRFIFPLITLLFSFILFLGSQSAVMSRSMSTVILKSESSSMDPFSMVLNFIKHFFSIGELPKGFAAVTFSFGLLSILLIPFCLYIIYKKKQYKYLLIFTVFLLPNIIFWILNPTPFRHFLVSVAGLSSLSSFVFLGSNRKLKVILLIFIIVGNFFVPEFLYRTVTRVYSFEYPNTQKITGRHIGQIPIGSPLLNHLATKKLLKYTKEEYIYLSKLKHKNIIILGQNVTLLKSYFAKEQHKSGFQKIGPAINKLERENSIYFVENIRREDDSKSNIYSMIIHTIGDEYDASFFWYMNPIFQSKIILSETVPENLHFVPEFNP